MPPSRRASRASLRSDERTRSARSESARIAPPFRRCAVSLDPWEGCSAPRSATGSPTRMPIPMRHMDGARHLPCSSSQRMTMTTKLKTWIWAGMLSCTAFQSASAQSVIFQDDFENGPAAWTFQNAWHLTGSVCGSGPTSGSTMARFGNPNQCGFNGAGRLITAAAIDLPADAQAARLRYESWEDTECGGGNCGWDHRFVYVSDDGGATWDEVEDGGAELKWIEKSIDLSGYLGQSVLIAFEFDDIDPLWNGTGGWMLDDVKVEVDEPGGPTIYCSPKLNSQGCGPL